MEIIPESIKTVYLSMLKLLLRSNKSTKIYITVITEKRLNIKAALVCPISPYWTPLFKDRKMTPKNKGNRWTIDGFNAE